jgi:hypothetical protein
MNYFPPQRTESPTMNYYSLWNDSTKIESPTKNYYPTQRIESPTKNYSLWNDSTKNYYSPNKIESPPINYYPFPQSNEFSNNTQRQISPRGINNNSITYQETYEGLEGSRLLKYLSKA